MRSNRPCSPETLTGSVATVATVSETVALLASDNKTDFGALRRSQQQNGSRYYRALESVSIASAISSALTIYPCQIRVHQMLNSNLLQLGRRSGGRPPDSLPQAVTCQRDTHYVCRHRTHKLPIVSPMRYQ